MSTVNNNTQKYVWLNGQSLIANQDKTNGKWYVTINGQKIEVDPNDLFGMNKKTKDLTYWPEHFIEYYDGLIEKTEEEKTSLEKFGKYLKERIHDVRAQYDNLMASLGVTKIDDIGDEANKKKAKRYDESLADMQHEKTSNSNKYYSACLRQLDNVLERGKWQNQYAIAEQVYQL